MAKVVGLRAFRVIGFVLLLVSALALGVTVAAAAPVVTASSAGYSSIRTSWTAVSGAAGYRVYRSSSRYGTYSRIRTTSALSYVDTSRVTGKSYYYKVRSYRLSGSDMIFGAYSSVVSSKALPSQVSGVLLGRLSSSSVRLQWSTVSGATGFQVFRAASAAGPWTSRGLVKGVTSFTDSGLSAGGTYLYKVRAYHLEGSSNVYGSSSTARSITLQSTWSQLDIGNILTSGQSVTSPNGQYVLTMQSDGNLDVRFKYSGSAGRILWSTQTGGHSGARLQLQPDGNLLVVAADGQALWNSGTAGKASAQLRMQDDGNLVVYYEGGAKGLSGVNCSMKANDTLYANHYIRSADWRYLLIMQGDGNLVLYDVSVSPSKALWATSTTGNNYAVMQSDGNLVVYRVGGGALWASNTGGKSGAWLSVQNDGNLVLYTSTAIWDRFNGVIGDAPIFPVNLGAGSWYGLTYWGHDVYGAYQHSAIDLNMAGDADNGQPIYAIQDGVLEVGSNYVDLRHTKPLYLKNGVRIGSWYSMYGHLNRNTALAAGSTVTKGTVLGWISHNGADNNHLHFVIYRNWNNAVSSAISPYWLPGVYSSDMNLYADDAKRPVPTRLPAGLYEALIFTAPPLQ